MAASDGKQILDLPSGYYFNPTDYESIHYLKQKILERELPADIIPTIIDLYTIHPQDIPYGEFRYGPLNRWWFFTSRTNNGDNNVDGIGYWRTITNVPINHEDKNIGTKKTRRFFYDENPEINLSFNNLVIEEHLIYEFIVQEEAFEPQDLNDNVKQKMAHFVLCNVCIMDSVEGNISEEHD